MAKVKFRSNVATIVSKKPRTAYVYSGDSYKFFHSRYFLVLHTEIWKETRQAAAGISLLRGNCFAWIRLNGGTYVEAYHAPHFESNILAVNLLTMNPFSIWKNITRNAASSADFFTLLFLEDQIWYLRYRLLHISWMHLPQGTWYWWGDHLSTSTVLFIMDSTIQMSFQSLETRLELALMPIGAIVLRKGYPIMDLWSPWMGHESVGILTDRWTSIVPLKSRNTWP